MRGSLRLIYLTLSLALGTVLMGVFGCSTPPAAPKPPVVPPRVVTTPTPPPQEFPVMLGIDVLEANGFSAIVGKKVGLLTHPAGVNRRGETTVSVLRRAPGVKLVSLFAPEHGIDGTIKAGENFNDTRDPRTGLPVYALYGQSLGKAQAMVKGLDALVIDLQDIGVRSYTFAVIMRYAMEACFTNGVEVVLLDRPNPLGGLKVDGPALDREWMSGVGAFRIPYVHGLTMGELARMAASAPGVLEIPDAARAKGRLTIIPMRGWKRSMRWPETGLTFVPTSPLVRDFSAVVGYAMVGLGCEYSGFKHGVGASYPFRGIIFKGQTADRLIADLTALRVAGVAFRKVSVPDPATGKPREGVYVEVVDWHDWNPTELSFELMRLACRYDPPNPFAKLNAAEARKFNIHVGSTAWWSALKRDGAKVDVEAFRADWEKRGAIYQQQTRKYWLYN